MITKSFSLAAVGNGSLSEIAICALDIDIPVTPSGGDSGVKYRLTEEAFQKMADSLVGKPVRMATPATGHLNGDGTFGEAIGAVTGWRVEENPEGLPPGKYAIALTTLWEDNKPLEVSVLKEGVDEWGASWEISLLGDEVKTKEDGGEPVVFIGGEDNPAVFEGIAVLPRSFAAYQEFTKVLTASSATSPLFSGADDSRLPADVKEKGERVCKAYVQAYNEAFSAELDEKFDSFEAELAARRAKAVEAAESAVSSLESGREEDKKAQEKRSKKYGIAIRKDGHVTQPSADKKAGLTEGDYADPCLTADTLVYTNPHGPVSIAEMRPGMKVLAFVGEFVEHESASGPPRKRLSARLEPRRVIGWKETGVFPIYNVRTGNNMLRGTGNHRILRFTRDLDGGGRRTEWVRLDELAAGDIVVVSKKLPEFSSDRKYSDEEMEFYGYFVGNGWVSQSGRLYKGVNKVEVSCPTEELARKYGAYLSSLSSFSIDPERVKVRHHHNPDNNSWMVVLSSSEVARHIESLGFGVGAHNKQVPEWVFGLSLDEIRSFLLGYLNADGHLDKHGRYTPVSVSRKLIEQVKVLALQLGWWSSNVFVRKPSTSGKIKGGVSYSTVLYPKYSPKSAIFGGSQIFDDDTTEFAMQRIRSIDVMDPEPVYDICVEGAHTFVADGFVTHNCNFMYPVWLTKSKDSLTEAQLNQVRNAPARFAQFGDRYDPKSRQVVYDRIVRALKKFGIGTFREQAAKSLDREGKAAARNDAVVVEEGSPNETGGDMMTVEELQSKVSELESELMEATATLAATLKVQVSAEPVKASSLAAQVEEVRQSLSEFVPEDLRDAPLKDIVAEVSREISQAREAARQREIEASAQEHFDEIKDRYPADAHNEVKAACLKIAASEDIRANMKKLFELLPKSNSDDGPPPVSGSAAGGKETFVDPKTGKPATMAEIMLASVGVTN